MLNKKVLLAMNNIDENFLEETAAKLGYVTDKTERIIPMKHYKKRTSKRFVSILVAACLVLSLSIVAYAADLFGIRALLIKDEALVPTRDPAGGYVSITQPQGLPEEMSAEVKEKIDNSTAAWAEWEEWRQENGIVQPEPFVAPENCSVADYHENDDGTWTVIFYSSNEPVYDDNGNIIDYQRQELERRTATAEEFAQDMAYAEAIAQGFTGYDYNYHVYSQEMANKLESIASSYGLDIRHNKTLMYQNINNQTDGSSYDEITSKINEVCAGGNNFFRTEPTGYDKFYFYDEGTFSISFYTTNELSNVGTSCYLYNSPYATLSSGFEIFTEVQNINAFSTRNHITPDGTEVTILCNGVDMFAYVYLENSFVAMQFNQLDGLSDEEINSIVDMIDFSVIE